MQSVAENCWNWHVSGTIAPHQFELHVEFAAASLID
jgi:hypothetical protein